MEASISQENFDTCGYAKHCICHSMLVFKFFQVFLFYILQCPYFSTLSVLCSCFQPAYFFLRFLLHVSSHFVSFTHCEEFSNTGFSTQFKKRQMQSSPPTCFYRNQEGKKKCPQCFTTNMALFKHQLSSVRPVFSFFYAWIILFQLCSVLLNTERIQELLSVQTDKLSQHPWIEQAFNCL